MRRLVLGLLLAATCGSARAAPFVIRTAGSDTAIAIDQASIQRVGHYNTAWTYEFFRVGSPLEGRRTQIIGILELINCRTHLVRHLKVVHYLASGVAITRQGPQAAWTDTLRGSNTDLMLRAACEGPSNAWAHRRAANVFALYDKAWGG